MNNETFNVNVLVNGKKVKIYEHQGRKYIEAKEGTNFELEIKNNSYSKILAITAIDGINTVSGISSGDDNDMGYIIDNHSSLKIKGYRYSNDEVASFKFVNKEKSYAKSKNDNSEVNCGVIGIQLYYEKLEYKVDWNDWHNPIPYFPPFVPTTPWDKPYWDYPHSPIIYCGGTAGTEFRCSDNSSTSFNCKISSPLSTDLNNEIKSANLLRSCELSSNTTVDDNSPNFELGAGWGEKKISKVKEVPFSKGLLAEEVIIYYLKREELIKLGIPLENVVKVNKFPDAFPSSYCKIPNNWKG